MTVQSMTGFARHIAAFAAVSDAGIKNIDTRISWEIRSVNGKGLDARFRIPHGFDNLEQVLRASLGRYFSRGSFQISLTIEDNEAQTEMVINEALLAKILKTAKQLEADYGLAPASVDGILSLRGIMEAPQATADDKGKAELSAFLLSSFDGALIALKQMRLEEGARLQLLLSTHVDRIAELAQQARNDSSRSVESISKRLSGQVELLIDALNNNRNTTISFDEQRLHMEAAFLATKADIQEELDRLDMHVDAAHKLLSEGGAVGRKLDFLSQEFNRETNTLCAKSNAASITAIGLELKAVVDQFREQIQNME